jgi:hypothetical protein
MLMQRLRADLVGLGILTGLVALASLLVSGADVPKPIWVFAYGVWVVSALFVWHDKLAPARAVRWLFLTAASVICAVLWFGFASLVSRLMFGTNEPELSPVFDAGVALMIAPSLAFTALAGWVRALLLTQ